MNSAQHDIQCEIKGCFGRHGIAVSAMDLNIQEALQKAPERTHQMYFLIICQRISVKDLKQNLKDPCMENRVRKGEDVRKGKMDTWKAVNQSPLHIKVRLNFYNTLSRLAQLLPPFTEKDLEEVQRGQVIFLSSHSLWLK